MSPFPIDPARAEGPMRLVLTAYPSTASAARAARGAVRARLAACASTVAQRSVYRWHGRLETAEETLVIFKTAPKTVGALFRYLSRTHPYEVPEIAEVDVPRAEPRYLRWLADEIDPSSATPGAPVPRRPAGPRGRGARGPGSARAPRRRRSIRS